MVKYKWNMPGFAAARTDPGVMGQLNMYAAAVAARAGAGFEAKPAAPTGGRVRGRAAVVTATRDARRDQARNHTLEKSL